MTGSVTQGEAALPGVTVTAKSPSLQGTRTTVTNENGAYNFASLPPGDYTLTFNLEGMKEQTKKVNVGLTSTARVDVDMKMSAVAETITVTASSPAVMETTQRETNFKQATINRLPMNRTPIAAAALAPGVTSGINGNVISGSMSYDNLYIVDGAVVQENLRGQPHNLFIEDAIQETTVLQSGISAEFGRFTGGVVSTITKSGGNEFSGSLRDTMDNPKWTSKALPSQADPIAHINNTYEETLGGRILKDRLWFFGASRQSKISQNRNLSSIASTGLPNPTIGAYTIHQSSPRNEGKLTANITSKHSIVGSYITNNVKGDKNCQLGCLDLRSINTAGVENPNNFKTLHYNGIITNNFLIEGDWAKKYFAFVGFGGNTPAHQANPTAAYLAEGSPVIDQLVTGATFNAPYFCGSCGDELRNNKEWDIKGRYFLGTKSLGTHNVSMGYDNWAEQRVSNNYQSPTDFRYDVRFNTPKQMPDGTVQIALKGAANGSADRFLYFPVALASLGSDLKTSSVFINDKWDLNQHLSFNLGARYDKNDAIDSAGHSVSNDKKISPRVGLIYDLFGNGRLRVDANYGVFVGRLAETVSGNASPAGNPATIRWAYAGPDTGYLDSREALRQAFQWFLDNGFTNRAILSQAIPGFNSKLEGSLVSPNMREISLGAATQLGKGYFRVDYINRDWRDFYGSFSTLPIGTVTNPANPTGAPSDLALTGNTDVPSRKYWGALFEGQYQLPKGFGIGGNYTYSKLTGNVEGETSGSGPVTFGSLSVSYPEFQNFSQNAPVGYLVADQRHKLRLWGTYDIGTPIGHFNVGVIERFDSGSPFSASNAINSCTTFNGACVSYANPALPTTATTNSGTPAGVYPNGTPVPADAAHRYFNAPTTVTYFFSDRGAFRWDDILATDLALNYELPIHGFSLFAKGEVRNVFNRLAVISGNTAVLTAQNNANFANFNPFTDTPKECPQGTALADCKAMGANFQLGPSFGKTNGTATTFTQNGNYQLPRTFLFALGARF